MKEAVTLAEACAVLGIERDALDALIAAGTIVTFTEYGHPRIALDTLGRYIRDHRRDAEGRRTFKEG